MKNIIIMFTLITLIIVGGCTSQINENTNDIHYNNPKSITINSQHDTNQNVNTRENYTEPPAFPEE